MTRRAQVWLLVAALLFLLVNVAGAVSAAMDRESGHAGLHAALALLGAYLVWRLARRHDAHRIELSDASDFPASRSQLADRLTELEQAVDTVAIGVERIGESERYVTSLLTAQRAATTLGERAPEPTGIQDHPAVPNARGA